MKVIQHCDKCGKDQIIGYACEVCGKKTECEAIKVSFGYAHYLDGEEYHFCSDKCLYSFFEQEIKKEVK